MSNFRRYFAAGLLWFAIFATPGIGFADSPHSANYKSLTAARLNPLGLVEALTVSYQYRLYKHDSPLFANNFVSVYAQPILSPAYARLGAGVAVQPLSILRLDARYQFISMFGNFNFLNSWDDAASADWSDSDLKDAGDSEDEAITNYGTTGRELQIGVLLQAKVGNLVVRTQNRFNHYEMDLRDGDTVWYDPMMDALMPGSGWAYNNDVDALYLGHPSLIWGLRYTVTAAFYDEEPEDDENNPIQRLGLLLSYEIKSDPGATVDKMSVFSLIQWHLTHKYRTGEDVSRAIPYFAIGLNVSGNLL